jgi:hypothetical protein
LNSITIGSNRKVWWICKNGHEWEARINSRIYGNSCPCCYGRKASFSNNLLVKFPDIASEWDYDNNFKFPQEFSGSSREKVWWKCNSCLGKWESRVDSRTLGKNGCPYCSGRNATATDNLLVYFPELCKEWNYEKNELPPSSYKSKSEYKAWWKCKACFGEWQTTISHRTEGTGCPHCSKILMDDGVECDSVSEAYVYLQYREKGVEVELHKRYPKSRMKCDFFIPSENKYVEVTGFHYQSKLMKGWFSYISYLRRIVSKRRLCKQNGIQFDFIKLKLTTDQTLYVRKHIQNNTCNEGKM